MAGYHGSRPLKAGWERSPAAQRFFRENMLGTEPVTGPLLVIAGEADKSAPFSLVRETARKACRHGIALTFRSYPGLDHDPTMVTSTPDQLAWIRERFDNQPTINSCEDLRP
jgi:acetyl esterase/lipase